jgi:hypothetical protein
MFADPARLDTDGDAEGFGDTEGEGEALGVADAEAVTFGAGVGVAVAVTVTAGATVSVTVGVGVEDADGDELVFTLLPLQPVAIMAMQASRARLYRSLAGECMMGPTSFFLSASLPPVYCPDGSSMTTLVDFTDATATIPGCRSSSSAASRVMRETRRNGPACISTWAATPSFVTLVMIPVMWLRAD